MAKTKKTAEQQLQELNEKMEQLKTRKQAIQKRVKNKERNERTKRLISIGAEVEHYAGCQITNMESFKKYLEQYGSYIAKTQK